MAMDGRYAENAGAFFGSASRQATVQSRYAAIRAPLSAILGLRGIRPSVVKPAQRCSGGVIAMDGVYAGNAGAIPGPCRLTDSGRPPGGGTEGEEEILPTARSSTQTTIRHPGPRAGVHLAVACMSIIALALEAWYREGKLPGLLR